MVIRVRSADSIRDKGGHAFLTVRMYGRNLNHRPIANEGLTKRGRPCMWQGMQPSWAAPYADYCQYLLAGAL